MSNPDFRTEPLRYVYDRLAELESDAIETRDLASYTLNRVRDLLDTIRPTIIEDEAQK